LEIKVLDIVDARCQHEVYIAQFLHHRRLLKSCNAH